MGEWFVRVSYHSEYGTREGWISRFSLHGILLAVTVLLYSEDMAWTPPINRRANRDLLDEQRFYRLLSQQCNYSDRDTVFLFYIGLVHHVTQELRRHKLVRLPHLGDMALVKQKPRPGWAGKGRVFFVEKDVLKFYPKERLRRYFGKLREFA